MTSSIETFGKNVRAARLRRRMSLEELSENAGVTIVHLSRIERGIHNPSLWVAWSICLALGENMDDLCRKTYAPEATTYNVGKRRKRLVNNGRREK